MLIVPIEEARAGMKLAVPVANPEHPDEVMLKPGYILTEAVLARLRAMNVDTIYIDYPDLADLDRHLLPHLSPARQVVYKQVKDTFEALQTANRLTVTFADYYCSTRDLIITLMQQGDHPIYMDLLSDNLGANAVAHSAAVAHLSLALGIRLQPYITDQRARLAPHHAREVVNLGVGAMLHDIGKTKLPAHLREYCWLDSPENDAERSEWEAHPQIGYEMLRRGIESSASAAVQQHHQYFDGSGFPRIARPAKQLDHLSGEHIHVFARIIVAANLYERLATRSTADKRRPCREVIKQLQTQYRAWIDPHILEQIPSVIPPYPPGSRVTMPDGSQAVVVDFDPNDPWHPKVRRLVEGTLKLEGEPFSFALS
jgi:HD-GYP domain-containing protein (c-di-GMP phosphodiesterase class II)